VALQGLTTIGDKWDTQSYLECLLLVSIIAPANAVGCLKNLFATLLEVSTNSTDTKELAIIEKLARVAQSEVRETFKPLLTLIQENGALESAPTESPFTRSEAEVNEMTARCEEPRSKQATLASLTPLKASLIEQLRRTSDTEE